MAWIRYLCCQKFWRDFVARTWVRPVLHRVSWSNEMSPNAPKHYQTHQNIALIAPVQSRVLCSNKMVPNAPKHYETHQNISLGSNGMDRVASLRKLLTRLRCTNFCINCTSPAWFAPSFIQSQSGSKNTQTFRNTPEHEARIQWYGTGAFVTKKFDATSLFELLH